MIDIAFYMAIAEYKRRLMGGNSDMDKEAAFAFLENCRSRYPVVFNLESTNACNMACPFCPRTTRMTRPVKTMEPATFMKIALQLHPHPAELWQKWEDHAIQTYHVPRYEQSENAFFLYILPRVVVLHGYGDPLLDPHIPDYVGILTRAGIDSYFSCNPANIRFDRINRAFENGLSYIKFSIDSIQESVRGKDLFLRDYANIRKVLEMKAQKNYATQVIITMIDTGREEFAALQKSFDGTDVYIYQKSLDQAWMTGGEKPKSIHWSEFCQIPWSSMSIHSDGLAVSCEEDFNNEIVLGDARTQTLEEIWNGEKYQDFRRSHFTLTAGTHCRERCDMRLIGEYL